MVFAFGLPFQLCPKSSTAGRTAAKQLHPLPSLALRHTVPQGIVSADADGNLKSQRRTARLHALPVSFAEKDGF
jgi:hypothetical protein